MVFHSGGKREKDKLSFLLKKIRITGRRGKEQKRNYDSEGGAYSYS